MYLNIAQAFLQAGNHFREFRPVLKFQKKKETIFILAFL